MAPVEIRVTRPTKYPSATTPEHRQGYYFSADSLHDAVAEARNRFKNEKLYIQLWRLRSVK